MPSSRSAAFLTKADDSELLAMVRRGDANAYGELWRRHSAAGLRVAHGFRNSGDADDLVSESFIAVHAALGNGAGPTGAFRPYLYATIRNLAVRKAEANSKFVAHEVDFDALPAQDDSPESPHDKAFISSAFRSLPARWQSVIWYVEVEQLRMAEVGALLGIKANAVSALVFRAKSALRVAWLQSQVESGNLVGEHRAVVVQLASYAQNTLRAREAHRVATHLLDCPDCSQIADEVDSLARRIAVVVLPLVLGGPAAELFLRGLADSAGSASVNAAPHVSASHGANSGSTGFTSIRFASASFVPGVAGRVLFAATVAVGAIFGVAIIIQLTALASSSKVQPQPSPTADPDVVQKDRSPGDTAPDSDLAPLPSPDPSATDLVITRPSPGRRDSGTANAPNSVSGDLAAGVRPSITGGTADRMSSSGVIAVSGRGSGGAVIVVSDRDVAVAEIAVSNSGVWLWNSSLLPDGEHVFDFSERRPGFALSESSSLAITVDTVAPERPTLISSAAASDFHAPTFYGVAEPGATVVLRNAADAEIAIVVAGPDGAWISGEILGLSPSATVFSAIQRDQAGNISSVSWLTLESYLPLFGSPISGGEYHETLIDIHLVGWPGQAVQVGLEGSSGATFWLSSTGTLDLQLSTGANPPVAASFTLWAGYVGSAGVTSVHFSTAP